MSVFKAYDVRGTYPDQVDEALFRQMGRAAVQALKAKSVVVGRDMRQSGVPLSQALIQGLADAGADVVDLGMCSTPMLYFGVVHHKAQAGAMVTASHNPAAYNGCKFCREEAIPVAYGTGLSDIERLARAGGAFAERAGTAQAGDVSAEYRAHLLKFAAEIKPLTVAVDTGNGVMGAFLPALFEKLPCELIPLYFEPDGTFPNHEANPLKAENLRDLCAKVSETRADLGIAFDGDGDRAMFVDERGQAVPADIVTALFAREMLAREPGAAILYDLRSSKAVPEAVREAGGRPGMTRVGHSFIKAQMREEQAVFAGELSGHFYWRDLHYTDNAEMAMLTMLSILSRSGAKLSDLARPLQRYHASGELNFTVDDTAAALKRIEEALAPEAGQILRLDGVSFVAQAWWANFRPSNTEPVLRLNLEADTAGLLAERRERLTALIGGRPAEGH